MQNVEPYIGLLIQVPLVGVFIWFALRLISIFMAFLDKRDESWQAFLEQQRKQNNEVISNMASRFADEIRVMGKERRLQVKSKSEMLFPAIAGSFRTHLASPKARLMTPNSHHAKMRTRGKLSGREDLNLRPLAPHASALAGLRHAPMAEEHYSLV